MGIVDSSTEEAGSWLEAGVEAAEAMVTGLTASLDVLKVSIEDETSAEEQRK